MSASKLVLSISAAELARAASPTQDSPSLVETKSKVVARLQSISDRCARLLRKSLHHSLWSVDRGKIQRLQTAVESLHVESVDPIHWTHFLERSEQSLADLTLTRDPNIAAIERVDTAVASLRRLCNRLSSPPLQPMSPVNSAKAATETIDK